MVANNKKHLKELESQAPDTSESNRAAQSQERTGRQTKQPRRTVVIDNSEDEEQQGLTGAKLQELSDKQELKLSKQLDKNGQKMIAYSCKICGTKIHRPTYDNSLTNLSKHIAAFLKKQQDVEGTEKLACVGVLGTGDINPREVLQLCVIWCAEGAQPFLALGQPAHRSILHPEVLKNLPNWRAVSAKISFLYSAVQETFIKSLAKAACSRCTPLWKGVQGLHANHHTLHAYNRRAYGVQACRACTPVRRACKACTPFGQACRLCTPGYFVPLSPGSRQPLDSRGLREPAQVSSAGTDPGAGTETRHQPPGSASEPPATPDSHSPDPPPR
ncbi:hypothetical protein PCASD_14697 [Puccinia coronata f. sp. avenae]|uniref:BED-type domain-containing protein n=1 Tax=Puccinia coronata f. sp. avenae TaxID=200324 RepID=A0A2N5TEN4_9BASI|nr:hypothetical protein PCASD_14697 [Puccinia coronata f. sp. avenae]